MKEKEEEEAEKEGEEEIEKETLSSVSAPSPRPMTKHFCSKCHFIKYLNQGLFLTHFSGEKTLAWKMLM